MSEFNKPPTTIDLIALANGEPAPAISKEMYARFEESGVALTEPLQMRQFDSLEEFVKKQNNFYFYFLAQNEDSDILKNNFMTSIYFNHQANKRFRIAYPDLYKEVNDDISLEALNMTRIQKLFGAYRLMSQLVDMNDGAVVVGDKPPDIDFLLK